MTIPTLFFAFLISSLLGALYHLIRGGGPGRLILYLIFSWVGFGLGHQIGTLQGWLWFPVGQLDLGTSILGSLVLLLAGDWLSRIRINNMQAFPDDKNGV